MHLPLITFRPAPFGLAFSIEDLWLAREWADRAGLWLHVLLDQTTDDLEVEELLVLTARGRQRRLFVMWRSQIGVVAQAAGGRPKPFATLRDALDAHQPSAGRRFGWLKRFWQAS